MPGIPRNQAHRQDTLSYRLSGLDWPTFARVNDFQSQSRRGGAPGHTKWAPHTKWASAGRCCPKLAAS